MRIIAGALKGRRVKTPDWAGLRPTSDKLRETLFNVWGARVPGAQILDAYAGTGAVGLEALSRGARAVTFVDDDRRAIALVRENLALLGLDAHATVVQTGVDRFVPPAEQAFDLVFLDPPYDVTDVTAVLTRLAPAVAAGGWVVVEHATRAPAPRCEALRCFRSIRSGDSTLTFFERVPAGEGSTPGSSDG